MTKYKKDKDSGGYYSAWFFDLTGGKTEYVVTIATVIGKSRMKGERIVTTLLPYGPEKPRAGIVKNVLTDEVYTYLDSKPLPSVKFEIIKG